MGKYDWLEKRHLRAVDQLRLWPENPRLNPEENHISLSDYASDLIDSSGEKDSFLKLINSISTDGFIPADPIVVWKNEENDKYYVAEGNRRILALKLLRNPAKAPRSLRNFIRTRSEVIERSSIEKIRVCIAPSFDFCEWYINQRHASSSIQRPWSRHQQQQWVAGLYDKYSGDIDKVMSITQFKKSELKSTLRILKIRDLALNKAVLEKLNADEKESVKSHRLPMTILERWFENLIVKEKWGIEFDEENVNIVSNMDSFLLAYSEWIKFVLHRDEPDISVQINTRTITSNLDGILEKLPEVLFEDNLTPDKKDSEGADQDDKSESTEEKEEKEGKPESPKPLYKDPNRNRLVVDTTSLSTTNYKLDALFKEFKKIPYTYTNCVAASLRVFLDLAVNEYTAEKNCKKKMAAAYRCSYLDIPLKKKLEYLKTNNLKSKRESCKVLDKLLNYTNDHSLDTLNKYIHGNDTRHTSKQFLNGFWDFLFPLFEEIIEIKEL